MASKRNTQVIITGVDKIDRRLKTLPLRLQKKVIRQAIRSALRTVQAATERESPVDTGATRARVKIRAVKSRKRGSIELETRIKGDAVLIKQSGGKPVFYPAVVEYKYDNFMQRAYESSGEMARLRAMHGILSGIEREASAK